VFKSMVIQARRMEEATCQSLAALWRAVWAAPAPREVMCRCLADRLPVSMTVVP